MGVGTANVLEGELLGYRIVTAGEETADASKNPGDSQY